MFHVDLQPAGSLSKNMFIVDMHLFSCWYRGFETTFIAPRDDIRRKKSAEHVSAVLTSDYNLRQH